jgi:hypothetical protein
MHSWIRRKLKFVLFYNYKFTKMNKQERVTFVINTLKEFYPSIPVPLDHKDPYTIAVLLSAQCTDVRVNQITPLLLLRQIILMI